MLARCTVDCMHIAHISNISVGLSVYEVNECRISACHFDASDEK